MKINLIVFGQIADIAGKVSWEIYDVKNTDELIEKLGHDFPTLQEIKYALAVNKEIIQKNTILNDEDTVAILPPFSGG